MPNLRKDCLLFVEIFGHSVFYLAKKMDAMALLKDRKFVHKFLDFKHLV